MDDSPHLSVSERYASLLPLHEAHPERYPFLLESVAHGPSQARFDILFAFPEEVLVLDASGTVVGHTASPAADGFLARLDAWWDELRTAPAGAAQHLPFHGGWFLYLGYELAGQIEPRLTLPLPDGDLPVALAVRVPAAVIVDHASACTWLIAEPGRGSLLARMEADLAASLQSATEAAPLGSLLDGPLVEEPGERYLAMVQHAKHYVIDGDIFQANLSRRWQGRLAPGIGAATVYRALRRSNPAPFAGLARFGGTTVVSSSPERLVAARDGWVETRPIAGTRPRGRGVQDRELSHELLGHPKERAEHVMLIDLERNDLGRVCVPGTVEVTELMVLESYAHVHHIVSNVRGRLAAGVTPGRIIAAVFPGGTITGCPKVRCMEIIAELEGEGRGPYTGSMGYLNRDGSLDLNILIRTLVVADGAVSFRAGAGIVADSQPVAELEETRAKARGLIRALTGEEGTL